MTLRNLLLIVILGLAIAVSMFWANLPMLGDSHTLDSIPRDGWAIKSKDVELSPLEKKWLGAAAGMKRLYFTDGRVWLLAVLDGTNNRQAVHDPTYCFIGEGWKIIRQTPVPLAGGSAMLVSMTRNAETEEALYWFFDGTTPFSFLPKYWAKSTLRRITRGISGQEPLLFILRTIGPAPENWITSASEVVPLFLPNSTK